MWRLRLVAAAAFALVLTGRRVWGCNVREVADYMQSQFRRGGASACGELGAKCTFDRQCCRGLECKLSASKSGVESTCQPWVYERIKGSENIEVLEEADGQPWTDDELWMVDSPELRSSEGRDAGGEHAEDRDKGFWGEFSEGVQAGTIVEIEKLQERKRAKLLKENEALEKLFTERDEKELEQLRALKEDAEMDELRKLKELRLRRKLELIKELRELRGLKAEENLNRLYDSSNATYTGENGETDVPTSRENIAETGENNSTLKTSAEKQNAEDRDQAPKQPVGTSGMEPNVETEPTVTKTKDSSHEVHHKKRHHQKHKKRTSHKIDELQVARDITVENEINNTTKSLETKVDENYNEVNQTETSGT